MTITNALLFIILMITSIQDLRKKKVSLSLLGVSFLSTLVTLGLQEGMLFNMNHLWGSCIGICLCLISILTRGAIGWGDGLVFVIIGFGLGFSHTLNILFVSLFLSALFSIGLVVIKKVSKKTTIPFIPFVFLGFMGVMLSHGI